MATLGIRAESSNLIRPLDVIFQRHKTIVPLALKLSDEVTCNLKRMLVEGYVCLPSSLLKYCDVGAYQYLELLSCPLSGDAEA